MRGNSGTEFLFGSDGRFFPRCRALFETYTSHENGLASRKTEASAFRSVGSEQTPIRILSPNTPNTLIQLICTPSAISLSMRSLASSRSELMYG